MCCALFIVSIRCIPLLPLEPTVTVRSKPAVCSPPVRLYSLLMTSRYQPVRLRQSDRSQLRQSYESPIDVSSLFPSKVQLAPPSSSSSFLSAWESTAVSSSRSSATPDDHLDSDGDEHDQLNEVELELPAAEKSVELSSSAVSESCSRPVDRTIRCSAPSRYAHKAPLHRNNRSSSRATAL